MGGYPRATRGLSPIGACVYPSMSQTTSYPDPDQLKRWAREPMPFHDVVGGDLELLLNRRGVPDYTLRVGVESVEYRFRPTYILVETDAEEWVCVREAGADAEDPESRPEPEAAHRFPMTHYAAWENAMNVEVTEDFVSVTGLTTDYDDDGQPVGKCQYDAYWLLSEVRVRHPEAGW